MSVSRLVPRKGMDVLIRAAARLAPTPPRPLRRHRRRRPRPRPARAARRVAPARRCASSAACRHDDLPALYGCADVFAMLCRNRWAGLEQEGFGIVFLEAAAAGVPQVAGDSGGAAEAVVDGETGLRRRRPDDPARWPTRSAGCSTTRRCAARMGAAGRRGRWPSFSYDVLAARLGAALAAWEAGARG